MAKVTKKSTVRSADPEAIRATVYLPPALHESMRLATLEARKERKEERTTGPRAYERITMSHMIVRACDLLISSHFPKLAAKKPKAAKKTAK